MSQKDAIDIIRRYVLNLNNGGIIIFKAYLFGSYARNQANENSDIDVMLVSETFDTDDDLILSKPWSPKFRIEPIAIGKKRFQTDDSSPIIEIVRKEGLEIN
jgi:predicted nucleotidyltransferase